MTSKFNQLQSMTTIVADTGDVEAIGALRPQDCTTNPTLILKAAQAPAYRSLVDETVAWALSHHGAPSKATDRLTVAIGAELAKIVPGRVSTEVNADLSFDCDGMVENARCFIRDYAARGIGRERVLIKLAATWEGIEAARILQNEDIDCNMTLIFSLAQAAACADASAYLISPFVGRILDWHMRAEGKTYTAEEDPGVLSVRAIYDYYKSNGIATKVMAASFRNLEEIEALAGCDLLTIPPQLLEALKNDDGPLPRRLSPHIPAARRRARMALDEKTFRWLMNEDRMATEKLSDGIRLFANDLRSLRSLMMQWIERAA